MFPIRVDRRPVPFTWFHGAPSGESWDRRRLQPAALCARRARVSGPVRTCESPTFPTLLSHGRSLWLLRGPVRLKKYGEPDTRRGSVWTSLQRASPLLRVRDTLSQCAAPAGGRRAPAAWLRNASPGVSWVPGVDRQRGPPTATGPCAGEGVSLPSRQDIRPRLPCLPTGCELPDCFRGTARPCGSHIQTGSRPAQCQRRGGMPMSLGVAWTLWSRAKEGESHLCQLSLTAGTSAGDRGGGPL